MRLAPALAGIALLCAPAAASAADRSVTAGDFFYRSYRVDVAVGDSVTWRFLDSAHTVTARRGAPAAFDSGAKAPGTTHTETFPTAGRYPYFCTLHPGLMDGVVQVGPDTRAPTLRRLKAKVGARAVRVRFRLGEEAKVKAVFRRGGRKVRTLRTRTLRPGARSVLFRPATLRQGRYVAELVATDPAGNRTKVARRSFRVSD